MIQYEKLEENMIDFIKENQLKLGYRKEVIRLYYPLKSINRLLNTDLSSETMQGELTSHFHSVQTVLGEVAVSHKSDRFCFLIPEPGVEYVHEHTEEKEFIGEFIRTIENHDCKIEDLLGVCKRYSDDVHFERISEGEFDYLLYFTKGEPDSYYYCITDEGCHLIYHRFTAADYQDF